MNKVAILVDGGFYRRVAQSKWGDKSAEERANEVIRYCKRHLSQNANGEKDELYRIFYYDCPPINKKIFHPLLNKTIDLSKSELCGWMNIFLDEMKRKRKVALRLGELSEIEANYILTYDAVKKLCRKSLSVEDLENKHFTLTTIQKGVDMKIGVDIASMAYKKQVDKIVLISGDSDFVPAAKLARREGIDFVLDAMHQHIKPELSEHIDGLRSCFGKDDTKI